MCIVVDTNTFSEVFNKSNSNHKEFELVLDWILKRNAVLVYGGSKYMQELKLASKYRKIFILLNKVNKTRKITDDLVDDEEERIDSISNKKDFNDKHLAAIVIVSKCRLICSKDSSSFKYLKDSSIYRGKAKKPLFYTRKENADLLCDKNIVTFCMPGERLNKTQKEFVMGILNG